MVTEKSKEIYSLSGLGQMMDVKKLFKIYEIDFPSFNLDSFLSYWDSSIDEYFIIHQSKNTKNDGLCEIYRISEKKGIRRSNYFFSTSNDIDSSNSRIVSLDLNSENQIKNLILYSTYQGKIIKYDENGREISYLKLDRDPWRDIVYFKKHDHIFVSVSDSNQCCAYIYKYDLQCKPLYKNDYLSVYGPLYNTVRFFIDNISNELLILFQHCYNEIEIQFLDCESLKKITSLIIHLNYDFSFLLTKKFNTNIYNFLFCRDDSNYITYICILNHQIVDISRMDRKNNDTSFFPYFDSLFDMQIIREEVNFHISIRDLQNIVLSFLL